MSLFGTDGSLGAVLAASAPMMDDDTIVTDAGAAFGDAVASAVGNSSGYPNDVAAAANAALANAGSISAADYSVGEEEGVAAGCEIRSLSLVSPVKL